MKSYSRRSLRREKFTIRELFFLPLFSNFLKNWLVADQASAGTVGARLFTGSDKTHFEVASNSSLQTGDIDLTIGFWVNPATLTTTHTIISKYTGTVATSEYRISVKSDGTIEVLLDATGETTITSTETISAGAWSFVLVKHYATLDKVEIKINETSEETAYALGLNATAAPFRIGRGSVEGGGHFDGDISKVFMFKGITTDVEDTWLNNGRVGGEFGVAGTGARLTVANGLVSTWNCNEADGTSAIYDSTGTNDLTLTTSNLLSNPGFETISGNTGRQWYVNHKNTLNIADNAALSTGDVDFCVATWFYADSLQDQTILAKWGSDEEYMIIYSASASRFQFFVRNAADSSTTILSADNLGAPSTGTWYLIVAWHDATGNTINIKVNNGTTDSAAHTTGVNDAAMDFCLGGRSNGAEYTRGRIGPTAFWKRADLDAAEHTWLYNSGQARLHHELGQADDGSDLLTNLQAYWDMNSTGTAGETDRQGANNLTITSYEILTNGDFASDITGWTNDATFTWDTTFAWSAGAMNLAQSGDSVPTWSSANQVVGVREGYSYTYGADLTLNSGSGQFRLNLNASPVGSGLVTLLTATGSGTISGTAVATGTDSTAYFDLHSQNNAASDWDVDNCTLKCNSLLAVSDADVFSDWVESTTGLSTCNIDTADVQAGNVAGRQDIDPSDSYAWFYQDVLKDGNYYTTTVQAKATAICTGSVLTGSGTAGDLSLTTSYQELSVATQLCTTDTKLYIGRKSGASAAGESLYFDTVSTVAATVPATTGPLQSIASDSSGNKNHGVLTNMDEVTAWTLDTPDGTDNPTIEDSGGNNLHGTLKNVTAGSAPRSASILPSGLLAGTYKSLALDGADDYVEVADRAAFDITDELTVCAFIRSSDVTGLDESIVSKFTTTGNNREWILRLDLPKKIQIIFGDPADGTEEGRIQTDDQVIVANDTWYHVAFTFSGGTVVIYVDGVAVDSTVSLGAIPATLYNGTSVFEIGSEGPGGVNVFNGRIADVRIYDTAIKTPAEIASIAAGTDDQTNIVAHWKFNENNQRVFTQTTGSLDFDGTDDHINLQAALTTSSGTQWSMSCWIKSTQTGFAKYVFDHGVAAGDRVVLAYAGGTTDKLGIFTQSTWSDFGDTPSDGQWHHLCFTLDGTSATCHVDAVQSGSTVTITARDLTAGLAQSIGSNSTFNGSFFDGLLSEYRIYNKTLTAAEILALYNDTDDQTSISGHWPLDDGPPVAGIGNLDPIAAWVSKNNLLFNESSIAKRPTFLINGINGHPAAEFDGGDDLLSSGEIENDESGDLQLVFRPGALDGTIWSAANNAVADEYMHLGLSSGNIFFEVNDSGTIHRVTGDTVLAIDTNYLVTVSCNGTVWSIKVNDEEQTLTGTNSGKWAADLTLNTVTLGALKTNSESEHFDGRIAELVSYEPEEPLLAESTRYLRSKYAV